MIEETTTPSGTEATPSTATPAAAHVPQRPQASAGPRGRGSMQGRGGPRGGGQRGGGRGGPNRGPRGQGQEQVEVEYEEKNLEIARVTRVTKGGKRMRFRALTVIGNRKGRVGFGVAKGVDVAMATSKATAQARKSLLTIPLVRETIPHAVETKFKAARVLIKPAPKGTGIKAGGAVRVVLELAGIPNIVSKVLGSANKINNVKATFAALKKLRAAEKNVGVVEVAPITDERASIV